MTLYVDIIESGWDSYDFWHPMFSNDHAVSKIEGRKFEHKYSCLIRACESRVLSAISHKPPTTGSQTAHSRKSKILSIRG